MIKRHPNADLETLNPTLICYKCLPFFFISHLCCCWVLQAVKEIKNIHLTNKRLLSELEMLRKRRITNCARFYQTLKGKESQI